MKPWLIVVLTIEAVLFLVLVVALACLLGSSSRFATEASGQFSSSMRGVLTPLNILLYVIAACVLIPAQLIYLHYRKRNRY